MTTAPTATPLLPQATPADEVVTEYVVPHDGAARALLEVRSGVSRLVARAEPGLGDLLHARFVGPAPEVRAVGGEVSVRYRLSAWEWLRYGLLQRRHGAELRLNADLPWALRLHGGVSETELDLRALTLTSLEVMGGVSELALRLPAPTQGLVRIEVRGGVNHLRVRRPAGVAVRLVVAGGANHLALDGQHLGAVGGHTVLATHDFAHAAHGYEVRVTGGVSHLQVEPE